MQSYELLFDFSRETTGLILGSGPFDRSMAVWFIIFGVDGLMMVQALLMLVSVHLDYLLLIQVGLGLV